MDRRGPGQAGPRPPPPPRAPAPPPLCLGRVQVHPPPGVRRPHVRLHDLRPREVEHRVGAPQVADELVPRLLERGPEHAANLAAAAVEDDLHAAAAARATSAGLIRSTASWNRSSLGPTQAADSRSGVSSRPARSLTASG